MVSSLIICYIMFLVDPKRILVYGVSALLISTQYFVVSIISALLKEAFEDIAVSLYDSEWYWLEKGQRMSVLKIMMMAQTPQAFGVGMFYEANLERFTSVSDM